MQTRRAIIAAHGGPEEFRIETVEVGDPGPGQIRIRHHAVGLNFIDVYQRTGLYAMTLPAALGMEAAGVVEAVGEGVTHLKPGDRAAYAAQPPGAYCEARVMPAAQVCPLPDAISFEEGAAMMLKGLTVQYLFRRTVPIGPGDTSGPEAPWLAGLVRDGVVTPAEKRLSVRSLPKPVKPIRPVSIVDALHADREE